MIKKNGVLYFEKFLQIPGLIHGFSTREFGNMRPMGVPEGLKAFALRLRSASNAANAGKNVTNDLQNIVRMNQVHSSNVVWVADFGSPESLRTKAAMGIDDTDGVLTDKQELFLSVVTADCVPLLFYDKEKRVVGAVHAGWRGVYKEIVKETVKKMKEKGSDPADIIVGIGPSIRSCCYDIADEHAEMFRSKFPDWQDALVSREGKIFLDLPKLVQYQLRSAGIPDTNIEEAGICTFETEELYSCRREGENFGEFMGIIGMRLAVGR